MNKEIENELIEVHERLNEMESILNFFQRNFDLDDDNIAKIIEEEINYRKNKQIIKKEK